jgi:hypothetical protein
MSFIYDDRKLLQDLLKAAQVQPDVTPSINYTAYHVADALSTQLQRQLGLPGAPAKGVPLGVPPGVEATAFPKDLRTLGDFLQWCADKQLTWEGKRFAWKPGEAHPTQAEDPDIWDFESMTSERSRDEVTRTPVKIPAVANVKDVSEYLIYLRDNEKNNITKLMLSKLIGELNGYLRTGNRKEISAVAKPENKPEFDPADIVDGFNSDTLSPGEPFAGTQGFPFFEREPIKLTAGDIASIGAFQAWLRNMKVGMTNDSGWQAVSAIKPESDAPCLAVNILWRRANWLNQNGGAADKIKANYSKLAAQYLKVVLEYGSKFTGKDGKPCAVITPGTSSSGAHSGTGTVTPGVVTSSTLQQIVQAMPFGPYDIDFNRIRYFNNQYRSILANSTSSRKEPAEAAMNDAETYMNQASALTIGGDTTINLAEDPRGIADMLQKPAATRYLPFLQLVQNVLERTNVALGHFYGQYVRQEGNEPAILNADQRAHVESQILGSNSYYMRNKAALQKLMAGVNQIAKFV